MICSHNVDKREDIRDNPLLLLSVISIPILLVES